MTKIITITIRCSHWLPKRLGVLAITLGRTIYCYGREPDQRLLVHECQHVKQWVESGRYLFLAKYLADYWRGRISGETHPAAYLGIGFEKEAQEMADKYETWQQWSRGERFPVDLVMR